MTKNYFSIDILRGFAASMVFFYHYGLGRILADITHIQLFRSIDLIGSTYAVPLFFLISGFCIHLSQLKQNYYKGSEKLNILTYFKRRFWRIYPIYFIVLLFSCTVIALLGEKITIQDFFTHLFVLQGFSVKYFDSINLVLWTITIEICFYLLYPLWYYLRTKVGLNSALIISIFVSIASWVLIPFFFKTNALPIVYFVTNLWGAWCFGAWLSEKIIIRNTDFARNMYWWLTGAVLLMLYDSSKNNTLFSLMSYSLCIALWAWVLVFFLKLENYFVKINNSSYKFFVAIPMAIGVSSYSLYMLHMPLMYLRDILLQEIQLNNTRLLLGGVWLLAILIISYFSYLIFEKPFLTYRSK